MLFAVGAESQQMYFGQMHYVKANMDEQKMFLECIDKKVFSIFCIQSVYYIRNYHREPQLLPLFKLCPPAIHTWEYQSISPAATENRIPADQTIDEWAKVLEFKAGELRKA